MEFEAEELLSSRIFDLVRMRMQGMPFMAANNAEQGEAKTVEQEEGKGEEEQMEEAGEKHGHEEEAKEDQEEEAEIQEGKEEHGYEEDEEEVEEKIAPVLGAEPEALENEVRKTPVKTDTIFFCVQEYVRKSEPKTSQREGSQGNLEEGTDEPRTFGTASGWASFRFQRFDTLRKFIRGSATVGLITPPPQPRVPAKKIKLPPCFRQ